MSASASGGQPVEVWWRIGLVRCKSCRSSVTFLQPLQYQLITYNLLKDSVRCLNDAIEVACNSGLKKSIADGMSAEGAGWWRGKEACEEGTRLYPASFVYIYNLASEIMIWKIMSWKIMICKIRHLSVGSYIQLWIRVVPVSLVTTYLNSKLSSPPNLTKDTRNAGFLSVREALIEYFKFSI